MRPSRLLLFVALVIATLASSSPTGARPDPRRITADSPAALAVTISRMVFGEDTATHAVVTSAADFPDALTGSALASYAGPLLFTGPDGQLDADTLRELARTLPDGATTYILGGHAAVPAAVEQQLLDIDLTPRRLGGAGRQQTAALVAEEVLQRLHHGRGAPFDMAILATEGDWPDAITVGQVAAWFAIPILLTPTDHLGSAATAHLQRHTPSHVLVIGGTAAVSDATLEQARAATGGLVSRIAGPTRTQTAARIAQLHRDDLYPQSGDHFTFHDGLFDQPSNPTPAATIVVDIHSDGGHAAVLAATTLAGNFGAVLAAVHPDADQLDPAVHAAICGSGSHVLTIGPSDTTPGRLVDAVHTATATDGCDR